MSFWTKIKRFSEAFAAAAIIFFASSCDNPFAPSLEDSPGENSLLGDQTTVQGVFDNFKYAYVFKDTLVYGELLAGDFVFVYRNYDLMADQSWTREQDMLTTQRLFSAAQNLELIWNGAISESGDSLAKIISNGFSLTIVFSPDDVVNVEGRAQFHLTRNSTDEVWKISKWLDESF